MSIPAKVRSIMSISKVKPIDFATHIGVKSAALRNRIDRNYVTAELLIQLADFVGGELAITVNGTKFVFDKTDLAP